MSAGQRGFWSKVTKTSTCWLWQGYKDKDGYGVYHQGKGKSWRAHRWAFLERYPNANIERAVLCHSCDTPACVNPAHLWVGDALSNAKDMMRKGRGPTKLRPDDIEVIRGLLAAGEKDSAIAPLFDVQPKCINRIRNGKRWVI